MPVIMTLKSLEVVSGTTHLKERLLKPFNQGILINFEHSEEQEKSVKMKLFNYFL